MHGNGEGSYEVDWAGSGSGSERGHLSNGEACRVNLVVDFSKLMGVEIFGIAGEEVQPCEDWGKDGWGEGKSTRRDIKEL